MAKVDDGTVSVKLDKATYDVAKAQADRLGLSVGQYLAALIHIRYSDT